MERMPALELDEAGWQRTLDINLKGTFFGAQAAAKQMIPQGGGAIINLSSYAGVKPRPNCADYASAKAGVAHLTQCLALEWSPKGLRVNAIAPGFIETPMSSWMHADAATSPIHRTPACAAAGAAGGDRRRGAVPGLAGFRLRHRPRAAGRRRRIPDLRSNAMESTYWSGKAAVVTGAARGAGSAAETLRLLRAGAVVHALDVLPEGDAVWAELRASAGADAQRLRIRVADVTSEAGWVALAEEIRLAGVPLYGLVNNAGVTLRKTVTETTPGEWRRLLEINLEGPFLAIRGLAGLMPAGASIVNTSSTAGLTGYFSAAYTASKWGCAG